MLFPQAMRDALCEALALAEADYSIERVITAGRGAFVLRRWRP